MKIWLKDDNRYPMWAIPEIGLFLSCLDNKPTAVDLTNLTRQHLNAIHLDHQLGKLEVDDISELMAILFPPTPGVEKIETLEVGDILTVDISDINLADNTVSMSVSSASVVPINQETALADRTDELKVLLEQSVATLKRELPALKCASDWKKLFELEVAGKNRKTVIALINELISKFNNEVSASILAESKDKSLENYEQRKMYNAQERRYLDNIGGIIETDKEVIKIDLV